jgi:wobble nucleotide-excising tRNase
MNAVFLNFCKLNEKVYTKIMEHELRALEEQTRMTALAASVDRKVADTLKSMKELHESTLSENVKSVKMMEVATAPLKKEIESKVDRVTFEASMKRIL